MWQVQKQPGGHLTHWWLYVRLSALAPTSSVVSFGCTDYAEVNPVPHLYCRGKRDYLSAGYQLLQQFLASLLAPAAAASAPPPPGPPPALSGAAADAPVASGTPAAALGKGPPGRADPAPPIAMPLPATVPPPPSALRVLADWDPLTWVESGDGYLRLVRSERLIPCCSPEVDPEGWAYALQPRTGLHGFFPPEFAAL